MTELSPMAEPHPPSCVAGALLAAAGQHQEGEGTGPGPPAAQSFGEFLKIVKVRGAALPMESITACPWPSTAFHCLSLTLHWLSLTSYCLSLTLPLPFHCFFTALPMEGTGHFTAFHWPFSAFISLTLHCLSMMQPFRWKAPPFLGLPLPFTGHPLPFLDLPLTFHCLALSDGRHRPFHCLSLAFLWPSTDFPPTSH